MARQLARGLLLIATSCLAACSAPGQPAAPAKAERATQSAPAPTPAPPAPSPAPPTRPVHLWPTTKVQGIDYVSVADIAAHYRMKLAWAKPGLERTLADSRGVRFRFESRQRDCYIDGLRLFLGTPIILHKGELWVSRLDVLKTIAPLTRPEDHLAHLPAAAPKVIVIDAGHGGNDPGKQNLKLKLNEKDMALDVVLRLKKSLELRGYTVRLTRSEDVRLAEGQAADLQARAAFAIAAKADLFLCVHFNAVEPKDAARVMGTETYVLTPQFQLSSASLAPDPLTTIALPGNRHDIANVILGYSLHRRLLSGLKTSDRGYKRARWAVLRFVECPAGYIEAAFLSNDAEAARIGTPQFRQQIAESIAEGVQDYAATLTALRPAPTSVK